MVSYEVVLMSNAGEQVIDVVETPAAIHLMTETPKYAGYWISNDRKILKGGKGEIRIREKIPAPELPKIRTIDCISLDICGLHWFEVKVENADPLKSVLLNDKCFIGYDGTATQLWRYTSIAAIADNISKELAYECLIYQDMYIEQRKANAG